ncbi:hypothetical protein [Brevibacillus sp. SYSU BS000544]|uniref:hypothetical protein n=1 Tax=Brevibacillus sp. SYSU BS000544 TaxID=3416443 RepID=UPI003CE49274
MEEKVRKPITYFVAIKVSFRLYALYLLINGLLSALFLIPFVFMEDNFFIILKKADEMFIGILDLLMGIALLMFTNKFTSRVVDDMDREFTLEMDEVPYIVQCVLKLILIVFLITSAIDVLGSIGFVVFLQLTEMEWPSSNIYSLAVFSVVSFIFTLLVWMNTKRIVRMIIR